MDPETLERLMLDRALGTLPPDCNALLAEYIEAQPAAAKTFRNLEETVALARRTLADAPAAALPAFPVDRVLRARRSYLAWKTTKAFAGIAASVLIGFAAHGILFPTTTHKPGRAAPPVAVQDEPEARSYARAESTGNDFWSARRLYGQRAGEQQPRQPSRRLIWTAPLDAPQIGGST